MTLPALLQTFVILAAVGVAGVLLYLVRTVLLAWQDHRARARRAATGPTADDLLAAVQRYMTAQGRQATADRIGEIRLMDAIRRIDPTVSTKD